LAVTILLAGSVILPIFFGAPWHPLRPSTLRRILEFAEIQPGETIVDLGSGDGRVLIAAAKDFGARGEGVEIDPIKVWFSRWLAKRAGVQDRVHIVRGNLFDFDFSQADVLFLYLTHQALDRLTKDRVDRLKPSARIVSFRFCLRGLQPDKIDPKKTLFLYRMNRGRNFDGLA